MEGALVETTAKVAEGAVVHPGRRIPAGQLWAGNPAVFIRDLSKTELADAAGHAEEAADLATEHAHEFLPFNTAYQQAEALGVEDAVSRAEGVAGSGAGRLHAAVWGDAAVWEPQVFSRREGTRSCRTGAVRRQRAVLCAQKGTRHTGADPVTGWARRGLLSDAIASRRPGPGRAHTHAHT